MPRLHKKKTTYRKSHAPTGPMGGFSAGLILVLILAVLFFLSFVLGRYPIAVKEVLKLLAATGLPIIMTTHFPDHAFLISHRAAIMKKGGIIAFGDPEAVMTDRILSEAYGIEVKVIEVSIAA